MCSTSTKMPVSSTHSNGYQSVLEKRLFLLEDYNYWATKQIHLPGYLFFSPKTSVVGTKIMIPRQLGFFFGFFLTKA